MINYLQLLFLGAFAGLTIILGLPLTVIQTVTPKKKGFLNAFAIGILIFLIVDVLSHAWESASEAATGALLGKAPVGDAVLDLIAVFAGIGIGLLGLTWYGSRFMKESFVRSPVGMPNATMGGGNVGYGKQELQLIQQANAYKFSMMIAIGIGAHNFSEGLAIGQSYASGAVGLAMMLIIGFATHNATEGFGIAAPLTGLIKETKYSLPLAGRLGWWWSHIHWNRIGNAFGSPSNILLRC